MDGFLRLTHGFCLERSSPVQAGPTGTFVYTASQARLGGPIFTPRCFPKKTSCRGPSPKVHHTENRTYHLMFLLSCCMLQLHTYYNNTETQYGTLWNKHCNLKVIFSSAHMDSECMIANVLYFLSWHYSLQGNLASLCVLFG